MGVRSGSRADRGGQTERTAGGGRIRRWLVPPWWSRNLTVVVAARVAMSAGRALAGVVTPIYLALQGFSAWRLSEYVLTVALCSAVLSTSAGTLSDRVGRKPFLVVMPLLTAAAGVAFALTDSVPVLFLMGAAGSFGRGAGAGAGAIGPYRPAESAFVTDILAARHRNDAFGRLAFGSSVGATAGGLLALLAPAGHLHGAAATTAFRGAFLAIAAVSAIAGLLALWLVEGVRRPGPAGAATPKRPVLPRRSRWLLYRLWATNGLNGMAGGMFGPFVTYWFFRRYGAGAGEVGTLFAIINVATAVSVLSAAGLARRWGVVRTVAIMRTAQAVLIVPMVLSPSFAWAGAVYFVRMIVQRIGLPLRQSYTIGLADPDERGSVAALSNLPSQATMAVSPLLTGYLFDEVSLSLPFELAAVFQLANAVAFWGFFRNRPPDEERDEEPVTAAEPGLRTDRPVQVRLVPGAVLRDLLHVLAALRGVDHHPVADVDGDVPLAVEEQQVARLQRRGGDVRQLGPVLVGGAGDVHPGGVPGRLGEPGAVEAVLAGTGGAVHVRALVLRHLDGERRGLAALRGRRAGVGRRAGGAATEAGVRDLGLLVRGEAGLHGLLLSQHVAGVGLLLLLLGLQRGQAVPGPLRLLLGVPELLGGREERVHLLVPGAGQLQQRGLRVQHLLRVVRGEQRADRGHVAVFVAGGRDLGHVTAQLPERVLVRGDLLVHAG